MDGTLLREGDNYLLRFERHLAHPVERVWKAVTAPAELAGWFPSRVELELALGAKATFIDAGLDIDPELLASQGTVTELDPPRVFAFTWGKDLLRFELHEEAGGCMLVFTHSFENRASAPRSAAGWSICLSRLVALLDDAKAEGEKWQEYFARYNDELGSDGTFKRDNDTAVVRFERLLDHKVARAWDAITKPAELADWLAEVQIDPRQGGRVEMRFANPPGYLVRGVVTRVDAPKVIEHTWTSPGEPDGVVKWQLIPVGESCLLLLTHTVGGHWDEAGTLASWQVRLSLLASSLAGLCTWPFPAARWQELHESYVGAIAARSGRVFR
ncbi:MAG: SRPBCC family protein [Acidimicrobiales bacterium]|jgi:uncharacterized protein YndB with AHSA1/START domain